MARERQGELHASPETRKHQRRAIIGALSFIGDNAQVAVKSAGKQNT